MEKASRGQFKHAKELLRNKRARDEEGLFVADGLKITTDFISKGHIPEYVLISRDISSRKSGIVLIDTLREKSIPSFEGTRKDFEHTSTLLNPQGVLAVFKKFTYPEIDKDSQDLVIVLCDGVQNPGNLGTIIRTSVAFGANAILMAGETVDTYNPKVVRASSGTIADVPIRICKPSCLAELREKGFKLLVGVAAEAEQNCKHIREAAKTPRPVIIAFGSEGRGVSENTYHEADAFFHIPIKDGAESLNVAAAAAITLYAFTEAS